MYYGGVGRGQTRADEGMGAEHCAVGWVVRLVERTKNGE